MHDEVLRREEELRAALLELERSWEREHKLRQQYQRLLRSLSAVAAPGDRPRLLGQLVGQLRDLLGAEAVHALESAEDQARLKVSASTESERIGNEWRLVGWIERALRGKPRLLFDAHELSEHDAQPFAGARSVLAVNVGCTVAPVLILATHGEPARFTSSHARLLALVAPLVNHALLNLAASLLAEQRRSAMEKAAMLEHATDVLGVGLAHLSGDDRVLHKSRKLASQVAEFGSVEAWWDLALLRAHLPAAEACAICDGAHRTGVVRFSLETPSNHLRHYELHFVGPPHDGAHPGEVMLVRDVTAEHQAKEVLARSEEQLRRAHKLEAVGRLAGGVAHDFNNTLGVILGSAELALRKVREADRRGLPPNAEYIRKLLEQVVEASRDGAALVDQLLAFSRRQVHKPSIVDLNDVVSRTTGMLGRLIPEGIRLEVDAADDLGIVRADAGQLAQVVLNLVLNARDAVGPGGHVTIRTANVDIDAIHGRIHPDTPPGHYVMLMVADDGSGIHERDLPRIFDPFFTTKQGEGTGLGLASVYGIVKQSGGAVEVESRHEVGTTFRMYFPRVDKCERLDDALRSSSPCPSGSRVLLVEDNDALREVMATSLEAYGFEVLSAGDPERALEIVAQHRRSIDVLLLDVRLRGMLGTELAERIREAVGIIPVLFVSPFPPSPGTAEAEAENLLVKPFTAHELAARVNQTLAIPLASHGLHGDGLRDG